MNEQSQHDIEIAQNLPLLAIRDVVIFTDMILPLFVSRDMSMAAIAAAIDEHKQVLLCTQKASQMDAPGPEDIYHVGTIAYIVRQVKLPDGRLKLLVQGLARAQIINFVSLEPYMRVQVDIVDDYPLPEDSMELEALTRAVREQSLKILSLKEVLSEEIVSLLESIESPGRLADLIVTNMKFKLEDAQKVLELRDPVERLSLVNKLLNLELKVSTMQAKLESDARDEMNRSQREYYLREQLRVIKRELGDEAGREDETNEYLTKMKKARLPKEALAEAQKQLSRLELMHPDTAESAIIRNYLDWMMELPWSVSTKDSLDLLNAKKILDSEHYNLTKVKDRILEYLAVMKLNSRQKGSIICFIGPPGVGKTSLGRSIARAMGRKFARFSLGGLKDEAEIRGHRRTYIGSMPGRILQCLKTVGTNNPVFMLDEIDKIGSDYRGDPAAALLEVLDPEQNSFFSDHYLSVPFDLSKVMFIATANSAYSIPPALEDRMEMIELPGYSLEEKMSISRCHLIPKLLKDHGLNSQNLIIYNSAISGIITSYTDESGVRGLERQLAAICRKAARRLAESQEAGGCKPFRATSASLLKLLGPPSHVPEPRLAEGQTGVATGLAWSEVGGSVMFVEVRVMPGDGNLSLTGQLGEVMKESAQTALDLVRSYATNLGLSNDFYKHYDIHVHFPAGSTPKEGPSAGLAIFVALVSALLDIPVPRDIAMTGELTLRGQVMVIGGLKEKALAALRFGIHKVILPSSNLKDLVDIPLDLRKRILFLPVDGVGELLNIVFPAQAFNLGSRPSVGHYLPKRPFRVPRPSRQPVV